MEAFILEVVKFAPAVAILLYLNWRQDNRNEKLVNAIIECYKDCEDRIEDDHETENSPTPTYYP